MKTLLMLPLWLIQVFTWSKSFRRNPIIGSPVLNRLGLHVLRVVVAEGLFPWRLWLLSPLVDREDRRMFREQGVKASLFVDDVSTRNAPHVYVPGSIA